MGKVNGGCITRSKWTANPIYPFRKSLPIRYYSKTPEGFHLCNPGCGKIILVWDK